MIPFVCGLFRAWSREKTPSAITSVNNKKRALPIARDALCFF
jgi:hypothetical protein